MDSRCRTGVIVNDYLDGCFVSITSLHITTDEEVELLPLFAEALGPNPIKTIEQAEAEWKELFNAPQT